MSGFVEPFPELIMANPGGSSDPLGESVLDEASPWLRIFEPRDVRVVIGRHQVPENEVHCAVAEQDGVVVHRRVSGGGAVVLAPGMVVVAMRLRNCKLGTTCWFDSVNAALVVAVAKVSGHLPTTRGHGDLTIIDAHSGQPRKILGASLRQTSHHVYYLGVFLVEDRSAVMQRYLRAPSREPSYRGARSHGDFCTHLSAYGASVATLITAISEACTTQLSAMAGLADGSVPKRCDPGT